MVDYILFGIIAFAISMADVIDFKRKKLEWIDNKKFRTWLLYNKVYMKDWMYPFFMWMADGWHFFKGLAALGVILLISSSVLEFIALAFVWMLIHEIILHGGENV